VAARLRPSLVDALGVKRGSEGNFPRNRIGNALAGGKDGVPHISLRPTRINK
jgi:hypothetical protein